MADPSSIDPSPIIHNAQSPLQVVTGELVFAHFRFEIVDERLYIDMDAIDPIRRLSNPGMYSRITDSFRMSLPKIGDSLLSRMRRCGSRRTRYPRFR